MVKIHPESTRLGQFVTCIWVLLFDVVLENLKCNITNRCSILKNIEDENDS